MKLEVMKLKVRTDDVRSPSRVSIVYCYHIRKLSVHFTSTSNFDRGRSFTVGWLNIIDMSYLVRSQAI